MRPWHESESATLYHGDALKVLRSLPDESADSLCTDPPSGISFMGKAWDDNKGGRDKWIAWLAEVLKEALRVLKPGAHALVWSIPRTSHWTGMAIEDAGFEVRDSIHHVFASGFPKNHCVSKAIDRAAGAECETVGYKTLTGNAATPTSEKGGTYVTGAPPSPARDIPVTAPATDEAKQWEGWGTSLKPSHECWILARKPFKGTIAGNVLEHGTGAINIDNCRVEGKPPSVPQAAGGTGDVYGFKNGMGRSGEMSKPHNKGRWPPNLAFSHLPDCGQTCADGCAVKELSEQSGSLISGPRKAGDYKRLGGHGRYNDWASVPMPSREGSTGTAARFFPCFRYCPKPSSAEKNAGLDHLPLRQSQKLNKGGIQGRRDELAEKAIANQQGLDARGRTLIREDGSKTLVERFIPSYNANNHPTVKPIELMRWLCRLITPPGGLVIDPFSGSGTTGCASVLEGFRFLGCDLSEEYLEIAKARIEHWRKQSLGFGEVDSYAGEVVEQLGLFDGGLDER